MAHLTALQNVSTASLRRYLFAISQYCRSVSDLTDEDKLPPTAFHSSVEPPISLTEYILGIGRRLRLCRFAVLLAAVYVARLSQRTGRAPSILSIHRLYAFSLLLACKTLRENIPSDEAFARSAGFPLCEVEELQSALWRCVGRDASDYEIDVVAMHQQLELASCFTLRSDITVAVARAFRVTAPRSPHHDLSTSRNVSPGLLSFMSPVFASLVNTPRDGGDLLLGAHRSCDSHYVFGSGITAVRGLRAETSPSDSLMLLLPAPENVTALPLLTFPVQIPQILCTDEEGRVALSSDVDGPRSPPMPPVGPRPAFLPRSFLQPSVSGVTD